MVWRLSRRIAISGLLAGIVALAAGGVFGYGYVTDERVTAAVVAQWKQQLVEQDQLALAIENDTLAETAAVGRQLAQMQARLWRMEALGARVTEVADLDPGEFSFNTPSPQGGPLNAQEQMSLPDWPDLRAQVQTLSQTLEVRERELEILDRLLSDDDFNEQVLLSGRPVSWGWMSSPFGRRVDPINGKLAWHLGVDFAGREGSDVMAIASGVVVFAGERTGYGNMIELNHGQGYVTRYGHHSELLVRTGEIVRKGQTIGLMGSSGRSTGPHVHFEVLKDGRQIDPARYIARRS